MRTIVIVPADENDAKSEYFANFVKRLTDAIKRDSLNARIVVADREVER